VHCYELRNTGKILTNIHCTKRKFQIDLRDSFRSGTCQMN